MKLCHTNRSGPVLWRHTVYYPCGANLQGN